MKKKENNKSAKLPKAKSTKTIGGMKVEIADLPDIDYKKKKKK